MAAVQPSDDQEVCGKRCGALSSTPHGMCFLLDVRPAFSAPALPAQLWLPRQLDHRQPKPPKPHPRSPPHFLPLLLLPNNSSCRRPLSSPSVHMVCARHCLLRHSLSHRLPPLLRVRPSGLRSESNSCLKKQLSQAKLPRQKRGHETP